MELKERRSDKDIWELPDPTASAFLVHKKVLSSAVLNDAKRSAGMTD